jgi:hypothetical protein
MPAARLQHEMSGQEFGRWVAYLSLQHEDASPASPADRELASMFGMGDD